MDSSSSFDLSFQTLDKSFGDYDDCENSSESLPCIRKKQNPVSIKIDEIVKFSVTERLSLNLVKKVVPIINNTPGAFHTHPESHTTIRNQ